MTTLVRAWFGRGKGPLTSGVSPTLRQSWIGLTPKVGGSARLNHGLAPVVTAARLDRPGILGKKGRDSAPGQIHPTAGAPDRWRN